MGESVVYNSVHWKTMGPVFSQMLTGERFVDVTLVCEERRIQCHRVVLAACSPFFADLLKDLPAGQYPVIILPRDVKYWMIQALLEFMYQGEVSVGKEKSSKLSDCAKILKIELFNNVPSLPSPINELKQEVQQQPVQQKLVLPTPIQDLKDSISLAGSSPEHEEKFAEFLYVPNQEVQPVLQQPLELAPNAPNEVIDLTDQDNGIPVVPSILVSQPMVHIHRLPDLGPQEDLLIPLIPIKDSLSVRGSSSERDSNERYALRPSSIMRRRETYVESSSNSGEAGSSYSQGSKASSDEEDPPRDFSLLTGRYKRLRRSYTRKDMWGALMLVEKKRTPLSEAAKLYNIPSSTLRNYAKKRNIAIPNSNKKNTSTTSKKKIIQRRTTMF
ncbi:Myb/SANT-like DNA-binding domain 4 [Sergentomyia squamirostris]